tara:strand:- start:359 stop:880 length:522 start_codon:yes stop_codon:yes gene_type:complete
MRKEIYNNKSKMNHIKKLMEADTAVMMNSFEPLTDIKKIVHSNQLYLGCSMLDAHSWIELDDGTIIDYDVRDLKETSAFGSLDVIRVPFPLKLQLELLPYVKKIINAFNNALEGLTEKDREDINNNIRNTVGKCILRTYIMKQVFLSKGIKCKVVYGSLGFKQPNNQYFYEFG